MCETTNDEGSKVASAENIKQNSINEISRAEIDARLENMRKDRLSEKNYFLAYQSRIRRMSCYFIGFPEKIIPADPSPKRLQAIMEITGHVGYVKLECAHCHKIYLNEPVDYNTNGKVTECKGIAPTFQAAGLDAELQYFCPHCVNDYRNTHSDDNCQITELWNYKSQLKENFPLSALWCDFICKDGAFILVLKAHKQILSTTIPQCFYYYAKDPESIKESEVIEDSRLTSNLEYLIALSFLKNSSSTYSDLIEYCITNNWNQDGYLPKLKVDRALQKILGVKIEYDAEEAVKTFKTICHIDKEKINLESIVKLEDRMKRLWSKK